MPLIMSPSHTWMLFVVLMSTCGITMADFVDNLLDPSKYDNRVRPGVDSGKPVTVFLDMFVNSISSIDEVNMEYTINIYMRQRWIDDRLTYSHLDEDITLNYNLFDRLWVPDLFVKNEKRAMFHEITVPNRLLILSPNGQVYYSQRLSLTMICTMNLRYYPMDNQTCRIMLESYGYTTRDIVFKWRSAEPIQLPENTDLPEFVVEGIDVGDCTTSYITGSFTCLYGDFKLTRLIEYYVIQTFVPSCLIVALSWVAFWIDYNAVPARITLSLLTVLTLTTQSTGISARLPRVSYIKAIDVWMTCCLIFVFGALIEYSIVNVMSRKRPKSSTSKSESSEGGDRWAMTQFTVDDGGTKVGVGPEHAPPSLDVHSVSVAVNEEEDKQDNGNIRNRKGDTNKVGAMEMRPLGKRTNRLEKFKERWRTNPAVAVDKVSRVAFPVAFMLFNLIYWIYYKS